MHLLQKISALLWHFRYQQRQYNCMLQFEEKIIFELQDQEFEEGKVQICSIALPTTGHKFEKAIVPVYIAQYLCKKKIKRFSEKHNFNLSLFVKCESFPVKGMCKANNTLELN